MDFLLFLCVYLYHNNTHALAGTTKNESGKIQD